MKNVKFRGILRQKDEFCSKILWLNSAAKTKIPRLGSKFRGPRKTVGPTYQQPRTVLAWCISHFSFSSHLVFNLHSQVVWYAYFIHEQINQTNSNVLCTFNGSALNKLTERYITCLPTFLVPRTLVILNFYRNPNLKDILIHIAVIHKGRPQKRSLFLPPYPCPKVSAFDQPPPPFADFRIRHHTLLYGQTVQQLVLSKYTAH